MNVEKMTLDICAWMQSYVRKAGAQGVVVGLSGGIDSAVVAALASRAFPENCQGITMPCHSGEIDLLYAEKVADTFNIPFRKIVLDDVYDRFLETVGEESSVMARANIKPRLRMTTLYYIASQHNYLVAGTGNKSELEVGYFTKYGDGGVDFEPIGHLLKTEVRELAKYLEVPEEVIKRPPTAGLWSKQTDEEEMGISYQQLDQYLLTNEAPEKVKETVDKLHRQSEHKRHMPPIPKL